MYGAPAVAAVLLFANGIPRVQRDILQVRNARAYDYRFPKTNPPLEDPHPRPLLRQGYPPRRQREFHSSTCSRVAIANSVSSPSKRIGGFR